jgi:uncharacterized protein YukE
MATLEKVMEMQQQGISDAEISTQLRNDGVSSTEIDNSLNQAKIKNAVSPPAGITPGQKPIEGMQASIMPKQPEPVAQTPPQAQPIAEDLSARLSSAAQEVESEDFPPQQQAPPPEVYPPQEGVAPEQPQDDYYQQTPQAYSQQDYYAPQAGMDTETISEIAEQVATEKLNNYKKKIGDIASFKNNIQDKVNNIDDRLKRIEESIDKLQQAIIGKIGEFGESNAAIHKDLDNLHGTVSKLMNPLIDNYNELKKIPK